MKRFFESELWKWLRLLLELAVIAGIILLIVLTAQSVGIAEGAETDRVWVICQRDSFVCIHTAPRKKSAEFGGATCGTMLETDGEIRNGYLHVVNVPAEETSGWISVNYIVYDEPVRMDQNATVVSNGRLAARRGVGGPVKKWLKPMTTVRIYFMSEEWCLTNYGYVQTQFLELEGEY